MTFEKIKVLGIIDESTSKSQFYYKMGFGENPSSRIRTKIKQSLKSIDVDLDAEFKMKIYEIKICPNCNKEFIKRKTEAKITCSYSCSNTYFRSGINNGSHKKAIKSNNIKSIKIYRTICFHYHKKQCIICGESNIVSVHHYDENHQNNEPSNLVPMCPTHHQYMHSEFKYLIEEQVTQYVLNYK